MEINISAVSNEEFEALVDLVIANHSETAATLSRLVDAMANVSDVLNEVAAGLRGPLATSILDLISERDAAEAARVEAVNALAEAEGREATETAQESAAAQDLRDAFGEVAGIFEDDEELPDVEPLPEPEVPADETPVIDEPVVDEPVDETPVTDEPTEDPFPADEPATEVEDEPVDGPETPADELPDTEVADEPAPADEPVEDGSGAIVPGDTTGGEEAPAAEDVPAGEAGASNDDADVLPNPGAAAQEN